MSGNIGLPSSDRGTLQFAMNYDYNALNTLKDGVNKLDDDTRSRETHSILIESGYSFTNKLSVDLFLSFVRQDRTINQNGLSEDFVTTQGIGDAVMLFKYNLLPNLTAGIGIKIPLGSSSRLRNGGLPLSADLQPGSGAWDQVLYTNFSNQFNFRPTLSYFITGIHRLTGSNNDYLGSSTYEFGNETQLIAGISDRYLIGKILLDPSFKARFRKAGRDVFDDTEFPSSGGSFLFFNPGVSLVINTHMTYQINIELPIYANVYDTQLSPTLRVNTGIFLTIPKKQSFDF